MVRAKFKVLQVTKFSYPGTQVKLYPIYDPTIPEDQRFSNATPSGGIDLFINNPAAEEQFTVNKSFYVDFTEADGR
jgi:hypothetical protein